MAKKKKKSGGGGGGGGGQQQEQKAAAPAEERDDKADAGGDGQAKAAAPDAEEEKDRDKDKGAGDKGPEKKDGKEKKPLPVVTAVLKVDMHCDGCARRIRASVRRFPGVDGVAMEVDKGSMTVVGRFDAKKLRDRVAHKTRKKVDLVNNNNNKGDKGGGGDQKGDDGEAKPDKKDDDEEQGKEKDDNKGGGNAGKGKGGGKDNKKPAVPVIVTVVLKIGSMGLHCDGCMHRIRNKLFKIKGVEQVHMDMAKNQVTVTGTMDAKALPEKLRKKLRRPVDVVQPNNNNKQQDKDGKDGKQQQQGEGGGGNKDGKQQQQGKEAAEKALAAEVELWKTAFYDQQSLLATEFMLSDENPNACAVM
ncbi:heavy metal-associated isoprenylated plant protein 3 [Brachypodium distachyon]|uniref:HMA domain-containing protein n=1 Tax=Brachypodium distachyon TaxID=15368 RepID=I1IDZ0_BRADI|nr:heavy metal-associated isoprenylated plant protein 3 [Brachypodium distachyon]KQK01380.1 hypothetical protein BRADI_3g55490v3 [Brachypodium distachyon]|eukprot:XP_014756141.1 heavy metal-associated isoprenylated plant protein 3 [Brachypodium distachyon]